MRKRLHGRLTLSIPEGSCMAASIKNLAEEISAPGKKAKNDETQSSAKRGKQQM
jgi:hypothetical protein